MFSFSIWSPRKIGVATAPGNGTLILVQYLVPLSTISFTAMGRDEREREREREREKRERERERERERNELWREVVRKADLTFASSSLRVQSIPVSFQLILSMA